MSFQFDRTRVSIALDKPAWPAADALFLPANDYLWMASGPALDVKKAAGEEIELEAVRSGPVAPGEVVTTGPGALPLAAILHGAVMGQDLHVDAAAAARAIRRGVEISTSRRWERLLVHSFVSAGRRRQPETAPEVLDALVDALLDGPSLREVVLLTIDEGERGILHDALLRIIHGR